MTYPLRMHRHLSRHAFASLSLAAFIASHPAAQQPPRTPERGADLLSIQFAAVGEDGTPWTDLRADEVKIRVGGRERAVRSLQLITQEEAGANLDLPPPFGTNAVNTVGRTLLIAVDEHSFRPAAMGPLRGAIDSLLARLAPADRVALVTMPYGGVKVPFTNDHMRVKLAFATVMGQASTTETGSEFACRSRRTLESLVSTLETIGVREEPGTTVFLTSSLAAPRRDAVAALPPGMCELPENLYNRVATAAGAARMYFYVVRPGDASDRGAATQSNLGSDNPVAGIEHLVGVTKGKMLALTGSSGGAMERIARETTAHYLASVESQRSDYSGHVQQLDVRVSRRGVDVRSLPQIAFANDPVSAKLSAPSIRDMIRTLQVFRDLPLRAAGFPALASDDKTIRIVVIAEPVEPSVTLESAAAVLFDQDGKLAAQWTATKEELQRPTLMGAMSASPGAYRLRVAAIDSTGRAGAADYELTAEVVRSGPLKLSSLVLGLSRAGGFVPKLQFGTEPLALAYVEMEGATAGARLNAALEVSQTLNGPAVATVPLAIEAVGETRYRAVGSLPVGALPPGDYVARAVIGLEGHPLTRVVRTIRKVAVPVR